MQTLLLALPDEALCSVLAQKMQKDYCLTVCHDGETALELLNAQTPDILIMDLGLPMVDGLQILRELGGRRPGIVLAVSTATANRTLQMAKDLGVDTVLPKPCRPQSVIMTTAHLVQLSSRPARTLDLQEQTAQHLRKLVMPEHRGGFQHLRVGIPLYAADPGQSFSKELYPAIAELCGNQNGGQIERAIRDLITDSWSERDIEVWNRYFPHYTRRPTVKQFMSNLARVLEEEEYL